MSDQGRVGQKNRVTSIPKNHALAQDNSTPTKQPHFTRDSYPLTPPFRETLRIALHLSKHRSWFSIAEYELSVLSRQCLARRVPDQTFRATDVEAWRTARNDVGSRFNWQFTTQDARTRFSRFPSTKQKHIAREYLAVIAKLSTRIMAQLMRIVTIFISSRDHHGPEFKDIFQQMACFG